MNITEKQHARYIGRLCSSLLERRFKHGERIVTLPPVREKVRRRAKEIMGGTKKGD